MNRLTKAWKALRGTLDSPIIVELVDKPVLGEAHLAKLYMVNRPVLDGGWTESSGGQRWYHKHTPVYYATCEQAHSENPGIYVGEVKAVRVGATYFVAKDMQAVKLQPKPKRPQGRA